MEQVLIGSCANSSFRDLMVVARALQGRRVHPRVSLEINPGSRQVLENLDPGRGPAAAPRGRGPGDAAGLLGLHRHGPGPAHRRGERAHLYPELPGTQRHQGRPGLSGQPRDRGGRGHFRGTAGPPEPGGLSPGGRAPAFPGERQQPHAPAAAGRRPKVEVVRGPNIVPFPQLSPLPETWRGEVWLKAGDNVTTDDILPAGSQILPLRSNLPAISQYAFTRSGPGISPAGPGPGGRGRRRRRKLRPGVVPGARRPGPPVPGGAGQAGEKLCPDPPGQPDQFRHPAPDL